MRPSLSRADLVRLLLADGGDESRVAVLGYSLAPLEAPHFENGDRTSEPSYVVSHDSAQRIENTSRKDLRPIPFLRMVGRHFTTTHVNGDPEAPGDPKAEFPDAEARGHPLPVPLLMPSRRSGPLLFRLLARPIRGRLLDEPKIFEAVARREPLRKLPRRNDRRFPSTVEILHDRASRLVPIREDQEDIARRIERRIGRTGCRIHEIRGDDPATLRTDLAAVRARPGSSLLILGDFGQTAAPQVVEEWSDFLRGRRRFWSSVGVLCPLPRSRWLKSFPRDLRAAAWDRCDARTFEEPTAVELERSRDELLAVLGPLTRIDPVLLRTARFLFSKGRFDIGTELDVWRRASGAGPAGVTLKREMRDRSCADFRSMVAGLADTVRKSVIDPQTFAAYLDVLARHREADDPLLLVVEAAAYRALVAGSSELESVVDRVLPPEKLGSFCARYSTSLTKIGRNAKKPDREAGEAMNYVRFRLSFGLDADPLWAEAFDRAASAGLRLKAIAQPTPRSIMQFGDQLRISPSGRLVPRGHYLIGEIPSSTDQPILTAHTRSGENRSRPFAVGSWHDAKPQEVSSLSVVSDVAAAHFELVSWQADYRWASALGRDRDGLFLDIGDRSELLRFRWTHANHAPPPIADRPSTWRVDPKYRPRFAADYGIDKFGAWADVVVGEARQRMRWIPPGDFMMGSPETEAGRWATVEPLHHVIIEHGFWLADTPCTQAFWKEVCGENPSDFVSVDRPVENVSWDDCRSFVEKVNAARGDELFRLPQESEWEYSCRAGIKAATYIGDLEIGGDLNAPILDRVAWYGGNCDRGFELGSPRDYKYQVDGQEYQTKRGGTHPVARLEPNPWGLFDMLGNVWEWCSDPWAEDPRERPTGDGSGVGARRVVRGGSWLIPARGLRAARRAGLPPSSRYADLGFRLARGRVSWQSEPAAEPPKIGRGQKKRKK